jgi:myo-inositol 2-dehydrogenase/D-chiro-inositol 1-dehydrogenase
MKKSAISRRSFLGTAAAAGAASIVVPSLVTSCTSQKQKKVVLPVMLDKAPDGPLLKAGLIGCGGRGTGAGVNFIHAGPNLTISALGDVFADRIASCRERLTQDGVEVADEN